VNKTKLLTIVGLLAGGSKAAAMFYPPYAAAAPGVDAALIAIMGWLAKGE
jgi:hypothetical protein